MKIGKKMATKIVTIKRVFEIKKSYFTFAVSLSCFSSFPFATPTTLSKTSSSSLSDKSLVLRFTGLSLLNLLPEVDRKTSQNCTV